MAQVEGKPAPNQVEKPELIKLFAEIEGDAKKLTQKRQQFDKLAKAFLGGKSEQFIVVEGDVYRLSSTGQNCRVDKMTNE